MAMCLAEKRGHVSVISQQKGVRLKGTMSQNKRSQVLVRINGAMCLSGQKGPGVVCQTKSAVCLSE